MGCKGVSKLPILDNAAGQKDAALPRAALSTEVDAESASLHHKLNLQDFAGPPVDHKLIAQAKLQTAAKLESSSKKSTAEAATEAVSSLVAGVGGTVVFSLASATITHQWGRALSIPMAMAAGGVLKYGSKLLGESSFVAEKDRTASSKDLLWGGVDAVAGIAASSVEARVAGRYLTALGRDALGAKIAEPIAQEAGKVLVKESLVNSVKLNAVRGISGGVTGAAIWSSPHRVAENWEELKKNPTAALGTTAAAIGRDTLYGAALGGTIGAGAAAWGKRAEIFYRSRAAISGDESVFRLNTYHINDFHSNTEQLPKISTLLNDLRAKSAAQGIESRFVVPGDVESGRVNFAFTKGGQVENEALAKMGAKEIVPGNHAYDAAGGKADVPRYPAIMEPILKEHPDMSLLAANLDVSAYPQYANILKPSVVRMSQTPWGPAKVGTIGVSTEEGALGQIKYTDAAKAVEKEAARLREQGVNIIQVHSHMGLGEDIKMAHYLVDRNVKISGILGGHTHDPLPRPVWVGGQPAPKSLIGQVSGKLMGITQKNGYEIPIVQAGHSGNWLGEFNQAIRPDGTAHRWLTTSKLHQVSDAIAEDPKIRNFLDETASGISALKSETYDAVAVKPYSSANSRNRETVMGNLMADAIRNGLKERMGDQAPQAVLVHSGGIRAGIPADIPLTRLELSNIVMNAGNKEAETVELAKVTLTGAQLKDAIEYGVREKAGQAKPTMVERVKSMFSSKEPDHVDESGNFVQVSGIKYSYDARRAPLQKGAPGSGDRVTELSIQNSQGQFEPVDPSKTYTISTRFHPIDKWTKEGIFGDKTIEAVHQEINAQPLKYSQVDLMGDYIRGKTLDPAKISALEGRITDQTPHYSADLLKPVKSIAVPAILDGESKRKKSE